MLSIRPTHRIPGGSLWSPGIALFFAMTGGAFSVGCAHHIVELSAKDQVHIREDGPHPGEGDQTRQASARTVVTLAREGHALSPDQENQVSQLDANLHAKMAPEWAAERALLVALADAVAAGKVDEQKLNDTITRVGPAAASARGNAAAELNRLHAMLNPAQRHDVAEEIIGRWSTATVDPNKTPGFGRADQLVVLIQGLGLTNDQVTGIMKTSAAGMTGPGVDPWRVDAQLHRLEAFRADTFDATQFVGDLTQVSTEMTEEAKRITRLYGAVAPVATPAQRAKLSQWLKERASRPDGPPPPLAAAVATNP